MPSGMRARSPAHCSLCSALREKTLIPAERQAVGEREGPCERFDSAIFAKTVDASIGLSPVARVGKIKIAFRIEDREIRRLELASAAAIPRIEHATLSI